MARMLGGRAEPPTYTVIGLPLAILVFFFERRKERANEGDEIYAPCDMAPE